MIFIIIFCCIGIFCAGAFVVTQYFINLMEWTYFSKNSKYITRINIIWGIVSAIVFIISILIIIW